MSVEHVRIVPVTYAAFERAAARDGAPPIESIEVEHADFVLGLPLTYEGLLQPGGHYLVRDCWITDAMSGKYVLNFKRKEKPPELQWTRYFLAGLALSIPRPGSSLYMGGAW